MVQRPLLTICIPTYNRANFVEKLLDSLTSHLLAEDRFSIEIVVVNNRSTDETARRLQRFEGHSRIRVVNRLVHYDTSEENVMRSLEFVRGEYVWFLGDDDLVYLASFEFAYERVRTGELDCLVFNSPVVDPVGRLVRQQPLQMNRRSLRAPLPRLLEVIGFTYTLAGVSNVIQRSSRLSTMRGLHWLNRSRIYSHVAWMIDAHKDGASELVNMPLVHYRLNDYSDGHWNRVAARMSVPQLHFWHLGLVRLLQGLVGSGALTYGGVGMIFDIDDAGRRYRLTDEILHRTYQQIVIHENTHDEAERLTPDEIGEIADFMFKCDPTLFWITESLLDYAEGERTAAYGGEGRFGRLSAEFVALIQARKCSGQYASQFVCRLNGYFIYRTAFEFVAIDSDRRDEVERVLAPVDPLPDGRKVLVAGSLDKLEALILHITEASIVEIPFALSAKA